MKRVSLFISLLMLISGALTGQNQAERDTSYTLHSALKKYRKYYPDITLAKADPEQEVVTTNDLVYASLPNRELHFDLFQTAETKETPQPLIIFVHGGGWRSGDKSMMWAMAKQLAGDNITTACIEYRLSTEAIYPAALLDIQEAIAYFKSNAEQYNIDSSKVMLLGCSAGASMICLAAVKPNPEVDNHVFALLNIDGVVDFTTPSESAKDENPDKPSAGALFFGCSYRVCPETWEDASAINYVGTNTPPTLFINSSKPRFHAGRDPWVENLKQHDTYYEIHTLEGSPHSFWLFNPWYPDTIKYIRQFIKVLL